MAEDSTRPIECAPVFVVRDLAASLAYYRDALGFDVAFTWGEPTYYGGVCRGAVTIHLIAAAQSTRPPGASSLAVFVGSSRHALTRRRRTRPFRTDPSYTHGRS